jgi:PAS domain S-box-containing protein
MDNNFRIPGDKINFEEYFSIFENINEAICINTKEGIIFFINNSTLELFGYSRDEMIGMDIIKIYANANERPNITNILEKEGFLKDFPVKLKKKNGEIIDCEFNTKIIEDTNDNKIYYGFIRNITERKKIEDKLKESEQKFRSIFEATADIITYVDNYGNILDTNSKVKDILGYERREIVGKNFRDLKLIDPEEFPTLIGLFINTVSNGKALEKKEITLKNKNGDKVYFEVATQFIKNNQKIMGAVSILRDITERKRIKEALEKEKDTLYFLLNELPGYVSVYSSDLSLIFANKFLKERFGEIEGKKCHEIFHEFKDCSQEPCKCCPVIRVFETEKPETCERTQKDGKVYEIYDYPFTSSDGKKLVMEFGIDITNKKLAEKKIIELNDTLRLLNKILRHDVLNNLMVISANIELVKTEDKDKINKTLEYVNKSAGLINRMKELESLVSTGFELKGYEIRPILKEISKNYAGIKFIIKGNSTILADDALNSVFDNIVRNAVIHGNTDKIVIKITSNNKHCEIKFYDYGEGIPNNIKNKIFDEGFSYGANKGTGLGLYIVKKTLERYGANIEVEDNLPKGATFILKFRKGD